MLSTGIIPAHAGSSRWQQPSGQERWDHPRACGEQSRLISSALLRSGSSPRMRGAARETSSVAFPSGIIPAHAGSSSTAGKPRCPARDHPRACGEQRNGISLIAPDYGSSPRMRGAVIGSAGFAGTPRIIPAHAGSRRETAPPPQRSRDHPRACGEQDSDGVLDLAILGSSPRMRGAVSKLCNAVL